MADEKQAEPRQPEAPANAVAPESKVEKPKQYITVGLVGQHSPGTVLDEEDLNLRGTKNNIDRLLGLGVVAELDSEDGQRAMAAAVVREAARVRQMS